MALPERTRALAVHLANSRIITPTLTDDAATLTVVLDVPAILATLEETRREALEEAAHKASQFSMGPDRSLHPDIAWEDMSDGVQIAAHSTAQSIAMEIRALIDGPRQGETET